MAVSCSPWTALAQAISAPAAKVPSLEGFCGIMTTAKYLSIWPAQATSGPATFLVSGSASPVLMSLATAGVTWMEPFAHDPATAVATDPRPPSIGKPGGPSRTYATFTTRSSAGTNSTAIRISYCGGAAARASGDSGSDEIRNVLRTVRSGLESASTMSTVRTAWFRFVSTSTGFQIACERSTSTGSSTPLSQRRSSGIVKAGGAVGGMSSMAARSSAGKFRSLTVLKKSCRERANWRTAAPFGATSTRRS